MRVHRERSHHKARVIALAIVSVLLVALVGGVVWGYSVIRGAQKTMNKNAGASGEVSAALTERKPQEPFTVLLLGNDKRPGEVNARADTIIVAKIDPEARKVWMLSIPRDTRVQIPGHGTQKINAANFYGGPALMIDTVEEFLGVPINHYMDIDFAGFIKVVDSLGGVWVDVDTAIDDPKASSHGEYVNGKFTGQVIEPGYQLLNGDHALTFVRSRDFPDADFTRMRHQQMFFKALADQATKLGNVLKIPGMVKDIAQYMSTDMGIGPIIDVMIALKDMGGANVQTATVDGEWKSPYIWTDEERKAELVSAFTEGRAFDATPVVDPATVVPSTVTVTVRNGAGIPGCAATAAGMLTAEGYKVGEVGNANQFVYDETLVVYQSNAAAAEAVAALLPTGKVVPSKNMYTFTSEILVVVGKDYATWPAAGSASKQ